MQDILRRYITLYQKLYLLSSTHLDSLTMQTPTHPNLHVRDAHDAHVVFEAVRQGLLRPIRRRLNEVERAVHVRSGSIFVWFESEQDDGLKRWTDGRVWGQSRMREPYLFYDEKLPYDGSQTGEVNRTPAFRFVDGVSLRTGPTSSVRVGRTQPLHSPTEVAFDRVLFARNTTDAADN